MDQSRGWGALGAAQAGQAYEIQHFPVYFAVSLKLLLEAQSTEWRKGYYGHGSFCAVTDKEVAGPY